jgi:opacity protein-like surface antigen
MKKLSFLSLFLLLLPLSIFSQQDSTDKSFKPAIKEGTFGLLFSFNGFSNISAGNFEGGIGVKYYLRKNLALRTGLQFGLSSEDYSAERAPSSELSKKYIGLSCAIEYHLNKGRISPYFGGGFNYSSTFSKYESESDNKTNFSPDYDILGFRAILGVEVFILEEISIAMEYQFSAIWKWQKDEENNFHGTVYKMDKTDYFDLGVSSAGVITLSFYF